MGLERSDWVVAPGFEPVATEFERNFDERGELGAAFAASLDGEPVVDLWGGVADRAEGRPWERDTLQVIFSGTKGVVAVCVLMLIDRGKLTLDDRICDHWPEFAAAGKEEVTVREVVSHTAGLPGLAEKTVVDDLVDDRLMAARLAAQPRFDDPRAYLTYHGLSYGWLCGELVRRVDGRSIGRFVAEEISAPLELELFLGLPERLEPRVSRIERAESWASAFDPAALESDPLMAAVWSNPQVLIAPSLPWNERRFHAAEIAGGGAIATARSVASLFGSLDRLLSPRAIELGTTVLSSREDALLGDEEVFGVGFSLQTARREMGPPADAFGHPGAGGSQHGCWPTQRVGFSYAMNLMQFDEAGDPRSQALLSALHGCVESRGPVAAG